MFGKIIKRSFWSWWDNLSFSIINSIMGGLNPFFLVIIMGMTWAFTEDYTVFANNANMFFMIFGTSLLAVSTFPTTVAAYSVQEKMIDGEPVSYFREYWADFLKFLPRSLIMCLCNVIIGLLLTFSIVFYFNALKEWFPINIIFVVVSAWFYFYLLLTQIMYLPILIKDKYKFYEYFMTGFYLTGKHGIRTFITAIIIFIIFLILSIPLSSKITAVIPMVTYMALTGTINIWAYRYITGEVEAKEEIKKRKLSELFAPFAGLFKGKKKKNKDK